MEQDARQGKRYKHSATELIRAGFWLAVGMLIVFPVVMILLLMVLIPIMAGT
jgi:hypothetical protein